jgi:hypothetical protein
MRKRASFETEANNRFGYTIAGTAISRYKHKDEKFYRKIGPISKISDFSVHQKHKACRCGYILRSAVGSRRDIGEMTTQAGLALRETKEVRTEGPQTQVKEYARASSEIPING